MQAGLANFLNTLRSTSRPKVHPVFRLEVWVVGLCLWAVIALTIGAL